MHVSHTLRVFVWHLYARPQRHPQPGAHLQFAFLQPQVLKVSLVQLHSLSVLFLCSAAQLLDSDRCFMSRTAFSPDPVASQLLTHACAFSGLKLKTPPTPILSFVGSALMSKALLSSSLAEQVNVKLLVPLSPAFVRQFALLTDSPLMMALESSFPAILSCVSIVAL